MITLLSLLPHALFIKAHVFHLSNQGIEFLRRLLQLKWRRSTYKYMLYISHADEVELSAQILKTRVFRSHISPCLSLLSAQSIEIQVLFCTS